MKELTTFPVGHVEGGLIYSGALNTIMRPVWQGRAKKHRYNQELLTPTATPFGTRQGILASVHPDGTIVVGAERTPVDIPIGGVGQRAIVLESVRLSGNMTHKDETGYDHNFATVEYRDGHTVTRLMHKAFCTESPAWYAADKMPLFAMRTIIEVCRVRAARFCDVDDRLIHTIMADKTEYTEAMAIKRTGVAGRHDLVWLIDFIRITPKEALT